MFLLVDVAPLGYFPIVHCVSGTRGQVCTQMGVKESEVCLDESGQWALESRYEATKHRHHIEPRHSLLNREPRQINVLCKIWLTTHRYMRK